MLPDSEPVIIAPRKEHWEEEIPPNVIISLFPPYWGFLKDKLDNITGREKNIPPFNLITTKDNISIAGPVLGSPAAVLLLEKLIALGAKSIFAFGCAGSIQPGLSVGEFLIPNKAVSEEGTSAHYIPGENISQADPVITNSIRDKLEKLKIPYKEGSIWTIDAPYRETNSKVERYQKQGVMGVEMEISALFTVGRFREVKVGALVIISDELSDLVWKPGFKTTAFLRSSKQAASILIELAREFSC